MSWEPNPPHGVEAPLLPLSSFLVDHPQELSDALRGSDVDGDETSDKGPKFKMGWYRVPRTSFDYVPASLDSILIDRGVKEPEERKLNTATLIRFERDARTLTLVGSFSDMAGTTASRVIDETLTDDSLSQQTRDVLNVLVDLDASRGNATFHTLLLSCTSDANVKLLRRQGVLDTMSLQPQLAQAPIL